MSLSLKGSKDIASGKSVSGGSIVNESRQWGAIFLCAMKGLGYQTQDSMIRQRFHRYPRWPGPRREHLLDLGNKLTGGGWELEVIPSK